MDGLVIVDKPRGMTSFDVVATLRRAFHERRCGHTGTLDPLATGILPLCFGQATKLVQLLSGQDKKYEVQLALGVETDTLDADGQVTRTAPVPELQIEEVGKMLAARCGASLQTPPMYSAVKVQGRRLYELAREGKTVDREPRPVTLYDARLLDWTNDSLLIALHCSKGFFVRVFVEEIGRALGCGAHVQSLRRTAVGPFAIAQATPLKDFLTAPDMLRSRVLSIRDALAGMPVLRLTSVQARRARHGASLKLDTPDGTLVLADEVGEPIALVDSLQGVFKYRWVLNAHA